MIELPERERTAAELTLIEVARFRLVWSLHASFHMCPRNTTDGIAMEMAKRFLTEHELPRARSH